MCKIEHLKNRSELFRTVEWKGDILYVLLIDTSIFMMQKKITKMLKYFVIIIKIRIFFYYKCHLFLSRIDLICETQVPGFIK